MLTGVSNINLVGLDGQVDVKQDPFVLHVKESPVNMVTYHLKFKNQRDIADFKQQCAKNSGCHVIGYVYTDSSFYNHIDVVSWHLTANLSTK